jgi:hypothetical protein
VEGVGSLVLPLCTLLKDRTPHNTPQNHRCRKHTDQRQACKSHHWTRPSFDVQHLPFPQTVHGQKYTPLLRSSQLFHIVGYSYQFQCKCLVSGNGSVVDGVGLHLSSDCAKVLDECNVLMGGQEPPDFDVHVGVADVDGVLRYSFWQPLGRVYWSILTTPLRNVMVSFRTRIGSSRRRILTQRHRHRHQQDWYSSMLDSWMISCNTPFLKWKTHS